MENLQNFKFKTLNERELRGINGGRWRIQTEKDSNGNTLGYAYRTSQSSENIVEYGEVVRD